MKDFIIAANWKMNKTNTQAIEFVREIKSSIQNSSNSIVICPPYTALDALVKEKIKNLNIGSQNIFYEKKGTYTGEISAEMLIDIGVKFVLVGHSERRVVFKEDNDTVAKKLYTTLNAGLKAILCIGEEYSEKLGGKTEIALKKQLDIATNQVLPTDNLIVAYEPVWAISSGNPNAPKLTPSAKDIEEIHTFIKKVLKDKGFSKTKVLYGGSVNENNCEEFSKLRNVDGFLIGGASLDTDKFSKLIDLLEK